MVVGDLYAALLPGLQAGATNSAAALAGLDGKVTKVDLLSDLKALTPLQNAKVFLTGKASIGDGLGGFYYWDAANTAAEDTVFMNVIPAGGVAMGRWVRAFQKARTLPGGTLVVNGGVKTYYCQATTDANGDATVYLTDDGTATGNPLFAEVWFHDTRSTTAAATQSAAVNTFFKSLTAFKTLVYGSFKANTVTVTLASLNIAPAAINPVVSAGAGNSVQFKIEGI